MNETYEFDYYEWRRTLSRDPRLLFHENKSYLVDNLCKEIELEPLDDYYGLPMKRY